MSSESTQSTAVPGVPPVSSALRIVEQIIDRSDTLIRRLHEEQFEPSVGKTLERRLLDYRGGVTWWDAPQRAFAKPRMPDS